MPKISIIVPIYNVSQYLPKCIESILAQTFTDFELLLVNDGSTDNCGAICDDFAKIDKRISVIHKDNGGLSDARNTGIKVAKGDYIGFVDSDDWIEPDMFKVLYNLCLESNSDLGICSFYVIEKSKNKRLFSGKAPKQRIIDSKTAIRNMYNGNLPGFIAWNKLYRKNIFNEIEFPKGRVYEDQAIMYRIMDGAKKIIITEEPLYNYVYRNSGITRSAFSDRKFDLVKNYIEAYSFMENRFPELCEKLVFIYFKDLRNMIVDIIAEKSLVKNYKYIRKICKLIKKTNQKIQKNQLISNNHKLLAQLLVWCPMVGILYYKLRIRSITFISEPFN